MACTAACRPNGIVYGCGFCSYNGARTSDQFLDFLKKQLEADKGFARVEQLDKLIKDFVGADKKVCACSGLQLATISVSLYVYPQPPMCDFPFVQHLQ